MAFQNKIKSAKSSSKTSVTCWICSTFLATDSKFDLGADLSQYHRILLQAAQCHHLGLAEVSKGFKSWTDMSGQILFQSP